MIISPENVKYMWIGVIFFVALCFYLGWLGHRRVKRLVDFTIAGEKLGPYFLGVSLAATNLSSGTYVGYVGWAYGWGYSALWIVPSITLTNVLGLLLFARRVRIANIKQKSQSLPDWLGDFFHSDFVRVFAGCMLLFNLFYIGAQLSAGAYVFQLFMGWPYLAGLATVAIVIAVYIALGGVFADVYTNFAQGILMAVVSVICFIAGMRLLGSAGLSGLTETMSAFDPASIKLFNPASAHFYAIPAVIGVYIMEFAFAAQPQLFYKVLALKHPGDIRKMAITYIISLSVMLLIVWVGLFIHAAGLTPDKPDFSIYLYVISLFPIGVGILLALVILSASLSTTNAVVMTLATFFGNDLYRKTLVKRGIVDKGASPEEVDRKALLISRIAVVAVIAIGAVIVTHPPAWIGTFIWIGLAGVASGTVGPLIVGIFMREKVSARGAIIAMIVGVCFYLGFTFGGIERSVMARGAWAICISLLVMFLYTTLFPRKEEIMEIK